MSRPLPKSLPRPALAVVNGGSRPPAPPAAVPARGAWFRRQPPAERTLGNALLDVAVAPLSYLALVLAASPGLQRHDMVLVLVAALLRLAQRDLFLLRRGGAVASWALFFALLLAFAALTASLGLFDPWLLAAWAVTAPLVQLGVQAAARHTLRHTAATPARAVIVGAGPLAVQVAQALRERASSPTEVLGFFDDRSVDRLDSQARHQLRGPLRDLAAFAIERGVQQVYVTLPLLAQPRIAALLEELQGTPASLHFVPDVSFVRVVQGRVGSLQGLPVITLCESPFTGIDAVLKRASDLLMATLAVLMLAPLMLLIAAGVALSSPGPVIFRQRRNGLDGREIVVWKFRTMHVQQEHAGVPQARRGDPRVTRFGAWLRRTSLDELPQFFNVLRGDMSVVGPRPHAVAHNAHYQRLIESYNLRHRVKPGITGWAQIHGCRGETDTVDKMRQRVEYDIDYLRRWSLALDLRIVWRTARLVLGDEAAY